MTDEKIIKEHSLPTLSEINQSIETNGFYHFQGNTPEDLHNSYFIDNLGTVVRKDDIKLYITQRNLHSPRALEFHTDSAEADLITWYCIEPGETPHPTSFLDVHPILKEFNDEELNLLTQAFMKCPTRDGTNLFPLKPLLTKSEERYLLFYTPWYFIEHQDQKIEEVISRFKAYVKEHEKNKFDIALKKGESIIIDNKRIFHGRAALPNDTERFLRRTWIKKKA